MRTAIVLLFLLLPGLASARQDMQSYTPDRQTDAPTFINAEVIRVNQTLNTVTFRGESGETTLTVDETVVAALGSLHPGGKVLLGYRDVTSGDGRTTRYVTAVRSASPASGEPARVVPARLTAGSTVRARVLSYDKRRRRVSVVDESGGLRALPLRSGVGGADALLPGANVALSLGAARGGTLNVTAITPLGSTPIFASGNAFPAVSGQFVTFNRATGFVTLDTTTAGRVTLPVASGLAGNLEGLRRGDNLSISFDVNTGLQTLRTAGAPTGPAGVVTTSLPGTVSPIATIIGIQPVSLTPAPTVTVATPVSVPAGTAGAVTTGTTATGTTTVGGSAVSGPVVVTGGAATSPFANTVPNIPAPTRVQGTVLPPAGASEPLSAEEVGTMRAQGERDLAAAAVALAAAASGIDTAWAGFKDQCLRGVTTTPTVTTGREWYLLADNRIPIPADDSCRALHTDLTARAQGFLSQLETVEDAARKADVLPVRVREVFDRHKLR